MLPGVETLNFHAFTAMTAGNDGVVPTSTSGCLAASATSCPACPDPVLTGLFLTASVRAVQDAAHRASERHGQHRADKRRYERNRHARVCE